MRASRLRRKLRSMPHKNFKLRAPKWVDELGDPCLQTVVVEALVARDFAEKYGAEKHPDCAAVFRSADTTLAQVADGRVTGDLAWRKASDALRKYTTAGECAHPSATRRNPPRRTPRAATSTRTTKRTPRLR